MLDDNLSASVTVGFLLQFLQPVFLLPVRLSCSSLVFLPILDGEIPEVGFLLIWQLVLVKSGDSRPTSCQNHRKQGTRKPDPGRRILSQERGFDLPKESKREPSPGDH